MTAQSQLEAYLGEFRKRLQALIVARGAALLAAAALVVTLLAVYFGIRRAFDPRESDLAPIDAATVERWTGLGTQAGDQVRTNTVANEEVVPNSLGPLLMLLLLMLVIVESAVGNWHLRIRRGVAA